MPFNHKQFIRFYSFNFDSSLNTRLSEDLSESANSSNTSFWENNSYNFDNSNIPIFEAEISSEREKLFKPNRFLYNKPPFFDFINPYKILHSYSKFTHKREFIIIPSSSFYAVFSPVYICSKTLFILTNIKTLFFFFF